MCRPIVPVTALPRGTAAVACEGPTEKDHAVLEVVDGKFAYLPDSRADGLVFNRTVTLRDTWAKIAGKAGR